MENDEEYFESLLCTKCKKNYWSDSTTKLCKRCLRGKTFLDKKSYMDSIMKSKSQRKVLEIPGRCRTK
jgi:hypothetical protein